MNGVRRRSSRTRAARGQKLMPGVQNRPELEVLVLDQLAQTLDRAASWSLKPSSAHGFANFVTTRA
jgi:hypothetical protein